MTKREKKYHQRKKIKKAQKAAWLYYDNWDDDDDIEPEPFGFECIGCGHIQDYPGECDICTGYCVEPMY